MEGFTIIEGNWRFKNPSHKVYTVRKILFKKWVQATGLTKILYQPLCLIEICINYEMQDIVDAIDECSALREDMWNEIVYHFDCKNYDTVFEYFSCQKTLTEL